MNGDEALSPPASPIDLSRPPSPRRRAAVKPLPGATRLPTIRPSASATTVMAKK